MFSCRSWMTAWGRLPVRGFLQAHRPHGPEGHALGPAGRDLFDGLATIEKVRPVEIVHGGLLSLQQFPVQGFVLFLGQGGVPVVAVTLVVAGGAEQDFRIQALGGDRGRDGVEEVQGRLPRDLADLLDQGLARQGAAGHEPEMILKDG